MQSYVVAIRFNYCHVLTVLYFEKTMCCFPSVWLFCLAANYSIFQRQVLNKAEIQLLHLNENRMENRGILFFFYGKRQRGFQIVVRSKNMDTIIPSFSSRYQFHLFFSSYAGTSLSFSKKKQTFKKGLAH